VKSQTHTDLFLIHNGYAKVADFDDPRHKLHNGYAKVEDSDDPKRKFYKFCICIYKNPCKGQ